MFCENEITKLIRQLEPAKSGVIITVALLSSDAYTVICQNNLCFYVIVCDTIKCCIFYIVYNVKQAQLYLRPYNKKCYLAVKMLI